MKNFLDFLIQYKEVIVSSLCFVLTFLAIVLKRRPKTLDEFISLLNETLLVLPDFISKVERPSHGADKKYQVKQMALSHFEKSLNRVLSDSEKEMFLKAVDIRIEEILKTPQKKVDL